MKPASQLPPVGLTYQRPPKDPPLPRATPWLDDITPTSPVVDDQDEEDMALAEFALTALRWALLILCCGFCAGYAFGLYLR